MIEMLCILSFLSGANLNTVKFRNFTNTITVEPVQRGLVCSFKTPSEVIVYYVRILGRIVSNSGNDRGFTGPRSACEMPDA